MPIAIKSISVSYQIYRVPVSSKLPPSVKDIAQLFCR
jgi:hypothetical protein